MNLVDKVAVLGAGLLGASFAKAVKKFGIAKEVSVWSRSAKTRDKCALLKDVFANVCDTPQKAVENADLIVICSPTANIPTLAKEIAPFLKSGAIVTDVGSVKSKISAQCTEILKNSQGCFIGSHPMAGSEKIGIDFSDENLFKNRPCFIMDTDCKDSSKVKLLAQIWEKCGMRVCHTSPHLHDAIVARTSHLPHILAGTLCVTASNFEEDLKKYFGPGFRDTTRVASGSPDIWDSIIADNKVEILSALKDFRENLNHIINAIETDDSNFIANQLRKAKSYRDELQNLL